MDGGSIPPTYTNFIYEGTVNIGELQKSIEELIRKYGKEIPVSLCIEISEENKIRVQREEPVESVVASIRYVNSSAVGTCQRIIVLGKSFDDV